MCHYSHSNGEKGGVRGDGGGNLNKENGSICEIFFFKYKFKIRIIVYLMLKIFKSLKRIIEFLKYKKLYFCRVFYEVIKANWIFFLLNKPKETEAIKML